MIPTYPLEMVAMRGCLAGTTEVINQPLINRGRGEPSWEQRFQDIQQELGHMKEVVKGRVLVSMDALVHQTESPFTVGVLHFPLPTKFRMPHIEAFDGTKNPVDHLNCKTQENSNFLKKCKMVISIQTQNFFRSRMTKQTLPLKSSREI